MARTNICNPQKFRISQVLNFAISSLIYIPGVKNFARRKIYSAFELHNNDFMFHLSSLEGLGICQMNVSICTQVFINSLFEGHNLLPLYFFTTPFLSNPHFWKCFQLLLKINPQTLAKIFL